VDGSFLKISLFFYHFQGGGRPGFAFWEIATMRKWIPDLPRSERF
jgi:hypothetical protein